MQATVCNLAYRIEGQRFKQYRYIWKDKELSEELLTEIVLTKQF